MRVFIAIDTDEVIKQDLTDLQTRLQAEADVKKGDVKWVNPNNIHLTLKFLGEIKDEQAFEVCNIAKGVASQHEHFDIDVETVGCFGGKSARVLWIGAGRNCAQLLKLQQDLDEQLSQAGWPKENREFAAHLTLCRIRNPKASFRLAELADQYKEFKLGTFAADAVTVYQSELTPRGPVYTVLGRYELQ
ncbi:MAG: RNA 2',3'-cyclic phosphodiesterase [Sedimentisphaerales bacterium]|nr:RNA 2',3'-cyclic phosphodiesterase [Sedimentisphaerales bacterium]